MINIPIEVMNSFNTTKTNISQFQTDSLIYNKPENKFYRLNHKFEDNVLILKSLDNTTSYTIPYNAPIMFINGYIASRAKTKFCIYFRLS